MKEHIKDLLWDREVLLSIGMTLMIIGFVAAACAIGYMFFAPKEGDEIIDDRFVLIEDLDNAVVVADKETRVLYLLGDANGITVLLDADGKPMLYKGKLP